MTRISIIDKPQEKVNVYLDGKLAFALPIEIGKTLHENQELSPAEIDQLQKYSDHFNCLNSAKRLIVNRPHSKKELKTKLLQKKYPVESIESALNQLESIGLINDAEFASYWIENRSACHPEGRILAAAELRNKGVSSEIINKTLKTIDESECAINAADRLAEKLASKDYIEFCKKISGFLARRGFSYETTRQTVETLWQKYKSEQNENYEYISCD